MKHWLRKLGTEEACSRVVGQWMLSWDLLFAAGVLYLNDRRLKGAWPGLFTGKLSDAVGLYFFPLLAASMLELVLWGVRCRCWRTTRWRLLLAISATGLVFAAINTSPTAGALYRDIAQRFWGALLGAGVRVSHTVDPTDLAALPMLGLCWWRGSRLMERDAAAEQQRKPPCQHTRASLPPS